MLLFRSVAYLILSVTVTILCHFVSPTQSINPIFPRSICFLFFYILFLSCSFTFFTLSDAVHQCVDVSLWKLGAPPISFGFGECRIRTMLSPTYRGSYKRTYEQDFFSGHLHLHCFIFASLSVEYSRQVSCIFVRFST